MATFEFPFSNTSNSEFFHLFSTPETESSSQAFNLTNTINSSQAAQDNSVDLPNLTTFINTSCAYSSEDEITSWPTYDNPFSILSLNSRSLAKNFHEINLLLQNFSRSPDIIAITETWLKPDSCHDLMT
jgi:hypothetical protein